MDAEQVRYSDDGHWYDVLERFPAALFDAHGYIRFATEADYRPAPMNVKKQISVPQPGISAMPGYVRMAHGVETNDAGEQGVGYATVSDIEGTKTEVAYFKRKRSRRLRDAAFAQANGVCSVCERDFSKLLGGLGVRVLQVHHRKQLAARDAPAVTTLDELAVVCANCHMLLHLDPEEALGIDVLRDMLRRDATQPAAEV